MFTGNEILDGHRALRHTHAYHFVQDTGGLLKMMKPQATEDHIKRAICKWQLLGVAKLEAHIMQAQFLAAFFCNGERRFGEVHPDDLARYGRKPHRHIAWP